MQSYIYVHENCVFFSLFIFNLTGKMQRNVQYTVLYLNRGILKSQLDIILGNGTVHLLRYLLSHVDNSGCLKMLASQIHVPVFGSNSGLSQLVECVLKIECGQIGVERGYERFQTLLNKLLHQTHHIGCYLV